MAFVPGDLVKEIMSRVPGKSLARFRSVSKQFNSLFSDPCFLGLHHSRSQDSLFTLEARRLLQRVEIDYINNPSKYWKVKYKFQLANKAYGLLREFTLEFRGTQDIRLLSSHHQLLCFACQAGIHLYDPFSHVLKELPDSPSSPWCFKISDECLVSFGFVHSTMQYKVIKWPHDLDENRIRRLPNGLVTTWKKVNQLKFEVLNIDISSKDACVKVSPWRMLQVQCPYLLQLSSQVHVNGFIYWTTSDFQIASFSLQDETFSALSLKPPCFRLDTQGGSRFFTLSGSRGHLWMIHYHVPSQIMEVWKMEQADGSWNAIHKMNLGGIYPNKNDGKVQTLDIGPDQVLFKLESSGLLICYDAKTNTLQQKRIDAEFQHRQLCHSTGGLFSLHNIHMSHSFPHSSRSLPYRSFKDTQPH